MFINSGELSSLLRDSPRNRKLTMPFSWKNKTRRNRFSQLVADHLQSPKRGGSLVVETGFPTSIIDLYVRNRGWFRKSSTKKPRGNHSPTPISWCSSSLSSASFVDLNNLSSSGSLEDSNNSSSGENIEKDDVRDDEIEIENCSKSEAEMSVGTTELNPVLGSISLSSSGSLVDSNYLSSGKIIEEDVVVVGGDENEIENYSKSEAEISVGMTELNPVLVVALKVLFMFVLVFQSKRFTVAITLSAFLLFFLESVRNRLLGRSISIKPSVDSKTLFECSFQETKNIKSSNHNTTLVCSEVSEIEQQLESNQEIRSGKESDEILIEISHKSSRRAVMKSRIKKLVPKKLRKSSMDSNHKLFCEFKEEEEPLKSNKCILKQNQDKIVQTGQSLSSSCNFLSEIECDDGELGRDLQQNSGCLILFLIVLVGLIGGRVLALVIALSWCLMQKKLQWSEP